MPNSIELLKVYAFKKCIHKGTAGFAILLQFHCFAEIFSIIQLGASFCNFIKEEGWLITDSLLKSTPAGFSVPVVIHKDCMCLAYE